MRNGILISGCGHLSQVSSDMIIHRKDKCASCQKISRVYSTRIKEVALVKTWEAQCEQ